MTKKGQRLFLVQCILLNFLADYTAIQIPATFKAALQKVELSTDREHTFLNICKFVSVL